MKLKKYQTGGVTQYQGTKYKNGDTYFVGNTGIHSGSQAVLLPEVQVTPQSSISNIKRELLQSPMAKLYAKDQPLSGTDPVGQFIVEGAALGKPAQYLLDKGLQATVGSTSGEILKSALSKAKSTYYNKAPWTFKPNPNSYYRAIPKAAIDDALETRVIRHNPGMTEVEKIMTYGTPEQKAKLTLFDKLQISTRVKANQTYFNKGTPLSETYMNKYGIPVTNYGSHIIEASDKIPFIPIKTKGKLIPEVMENLGKNYNPEIKGMAIPKANVLPEKVIPLDENVKLYKPDWFRGFKEVPKTNQFSKQSFNSEINWDKWNPEIPKNKQLLNEYNNIEQASKASGNWMKNPDGSVFKGTPEQFIQQRSENFKRAFPNPILDKNKNIQINYHGSRYGLKGDRFNEKYSNRYGSVHGSGIYTTPNKDFAIDYATRTPKGKLYNLYINSNNPQKEIQLKYDPNISMDDATLKSAYDFLKVGEEQVIPFTNYPKSATWNNGMFDMKNPNIYKTIAAGLSLQGLNKINNNQRKK